jgi:hypothetical protein
MKISRFLLSAAALAALLVAPVAFGCDDHAKAGKASAKGEKMSCAAHAKAGKDGMACCAAHAKKGDKASSSCPMKASDAKKTDVAMVGKVLCEHCDLHKADSCRTVFQAEGKTDYMPICPMSDVAALKKAGEHGDKLIDVKGTMCEDKAGAKMLMVSSFAVKAS